jgi:hypothetical protein
MIKNKSIPKQNQTIIKLLNTGIFSKIGTNFRTNILKLKDTNYYVVISEKSNEKIEWYLIPPGSIAIDECIFFKNTAPSILDTSPKVKKVSIQEVFESSNRIIQDRLMDHISLFVKIEKKRVR